MVSLSLGWDEFLLNHIDGPGQSPYIVSSRVRDKTVGYWMGLKCTERIRNEQV